MVALARLNQAANFINESLRTDEHHLTLAGLPVLQYFQQQFAARIIDLADDA